MFFLNPRSKHYEEENKENMMIFSNMRGNKINEKDNIIAQLLSQVSNLAEENKKLKQEKSPSSLIVTANKYFNFIFLTFFHQTSTINSRNPSQRNSVT
jgi:hypothetical protein